MDKMIGKGDEMTEQPSMTALLNRANEIFYRVGNGTGEVVLEVAYSQGCYLRVGAPFIMRNAAPFNGYGVYFVRCSHTKPPFKINVDGATVTVFEELSLTEVTDMSLLSQSVCHFPELYTRLVDRVTLLRSFGEHALDNLQKFVEAHKG